MAEAKPVVVITGASAGVGRATAVEFGRHGATVALIARGKAGLQAAAEDVRQAGGHASIHPCDVSDAAEVERVAGEIEQQHGPIDIWINDAMTTVFAFISDIKPEEFERATKVTYLGFVWGTMAALRRMLPRDRGTIVQVGSALAYRGIPLQSAYCGAKHAMLGFQESLITELKHKKSRVQTTMVHLPGMNTPQFDHCLNRMPEQPQPVKPIYQPEVAARAIYHAALHPRRREFYVGFPTVYTIIGNKIAPWFADFYLARTGVSGQQAGIPPQSQAVNLFSPTDESRDETAHGPFSDSAKNRSYQAWLSRHRLVALGVLAGGASGVATALAARRS